MSIYANKSSHFKARMSEIEEEEGDWQKKYVDLTEKVHTLETLSKDVLKEHADNQKKYEELKKQNEELQRKVDEKSEKLVQLNQLIEPAVEEYSKLRNKYEIEKGCRYEAQTYAVQMVKKNKKLQRQSMDLIGLLNRTDMSITEINIDELDKEDDTPIDVQLQSSVQNTVKELKNEVATLKTTVSKLQEELQLEMEGRKWATEKCKSLKSQLVQTESALKSHKQAMKELSKVSEAAYEEYESLSERYELEKKRRSFVERKVAEFTVENTKMKRQSEALLSKVTPGDQLHHALMQIEDLQQKLEDQRQYYDKQITDLETRVTEGDGQSDVLEGLERERLELSTERDDLTGKLREYEDKYAKLEADYDVLLKKYEEAKRPPPPPPPPPPPAISTSKGFLSRITKKKKKADIESTIKLKGGTYNEDFNKALDEMLSNIKNGKSLRPTLRRTNTEPERSVAAGFRTVLKARSFDDLSEKDAPPSGGAMKELHNIMFKMKSARSESDLLAPLEKEEGQSQSELAMVFRKVRRTQSEDKEPDFTRRTQLSQVSEERDSEVFNN